MNIESITGAILGCAVGDAIGLPYEGVSIRRAKKLLGEPDRHRFLFGHGMVSDDTEHTCMVGQALCASPQDANQFAVNLAKRLKWWLLSCPAGIGLATLRSCFRLWMGYSPQRSGVFSAGNGPAMRSAVLGAAIDDLPTLKTYVLASTRITHTDPKAQEGAFAVALAAWCACRGISTTAAFFEKYLSTCRDELSSEWLGLMQQVQDSLAGGLTTEEFARQLCGSKGVSGYVYRTVPVVLHGWLSQPQDFRQAISSIIGCGGDADTTAAILGGIMGSQVGKAGIPADWLNGLWEWPRTQRWMCQLAERVNDAYIKKMPVKAPEFSFFAEIIRNVFFLAIVIGHVIRRLLPPY